MTASVQDRVRKWQAPGPCQKMPGLWPAYLSLVQVRDPCAHLFSKLHLLLQLPPLSLFYPQVIQAEMGVPRGPPELWRALSGDLLCGDGGWGPCHYFRGRHQPLSRLCVRSSLITGRTGLLVWRLFQGDVALECRGDAIRDRSKGKATGDAVSSPRVS